MLKERTELLRKVIIAADVCLVSGAYFLGYFVASRFSVLEPLGRYIKFLPIFAIIWGLLLYVLEMYESFRTKSVGEVLNTVLEIVLIGVGGSGIFLYFFGIDYVSRLFLLVVFVFAGMFLAAEKAALMLVFRQVRKSGYNYRNVLIVGTGDRAVDYVEILRKHEEWGFKVVGFIDEDKSRVGQDIGGVKVIGALSDVPDIVHNSVIDEVVFIVPRMWLGRIEETMLFCETEGIKISVAMDYFNLRRSQVKQAQLGGFPLLTFESAPSKLWPLLEKRLFDVFVSGTLLVILSPVFLLIAVIVKATSKGPVLFRQERCGLSGRRFTLYKFRTMVDGAESRIDELLLKNEMKGPAFKFADDPRITKIGKILRKTSLDELPQLWNVLAGDMSLVGPRPPLPAEVKIYEPWHRRRLSMRPGLTCLWQVSGRNKITDFDEWAALDLEYIDKWSLWLDGWILLKTIPVVLFGVGAK